MVVTLGAAPQKKTGRVAPRSTPLVGRTRSVGLKRAAAGALTTLAGGPPFGLVNGTDRDGFSLQIPTAKGTECSYWVYRRRPGALTSFPTYTSLLYFDAMLQHKRQQPVQDIRLRRRRHAHTAGREQQQQPPPPQPFQPPLSLLPRCLVPQSSEQSPIPPAAT